MKKHLSRSYIRAFFLFFTSMLLLTSLVTYMYTKNQEQEAKSQLFLKMKAFSLSLKGDAFALDVVDTNSSLQTYKLYESQQDIFSYFPILDIENSWLKVSLSQKQFRESVAPLYQRLWTISGIVVIIVIFLSALFAWYALYPLEASYRLMERFLKDIIHDLNTPVTAILLNSKLLRKKQSEKRLHRIELAAQTIEGLHKNLESFIRDTPEEAMRFDLDRLIQERVDYFEGLYTALAFKLELDKVSVESHYGAWKRIVDNIISNACKYNDPKGTVSIILKEGMLRIADQGSGIKVPKKVFERFYKEGERGLGLGLNIVKTLADKLSISIEIIALDKGTAFVLRW